ncbi:MAG: AsmA family protein [Myxococcota bacterium]|nr:AsmA family protein [Myxococcota bacterium]
MKLLRRILLGVAIFVALIVAAFVVVVSIGIHVDLDPLRVPAQTLASTALDREVTLDGPMVLVPTWSPTVEVKGLRIGNPKGWPSPELARMDLARVTVGVLPILRGRAVVRELTAEGVSVVLERTAEGRVNWLLALPDAEPASEEPREEEPFDLKGLFIRSVAVEKLTLADIVVDLRDDLAGRHGVFELAELDGTLGTHDPLEVTIWGKLGEERYDVSVSGGPPIDLLRSEQPWPLELAVDVVDTKLTVSTRIEEPFSLDALSPEEAAVPLLPAGRRFGALEVALRGETLESFERLVPVDLPGWGPHGFTGTVEVFEGGRYEAEIQVEVGTSRLTGRLEATQGQPPRVDVTLAAPTVQLDDFDTTGWSAFGEEAPADEVDEPDATRPATAGVLSPEVMRALDARLQVSVEQVVSGRDRLGRGHFTAALEQGRFRLEPFELEVPGGKANLGITFEPLADGVSWEFQAAVDRFDYGILARRVDPATDMGGLFALDIALASKAPSPRDLMAHASGRFDFAVFPENTDASLVDLWAVNLVAAALPAVDSAEQSRINCVVGLFDMEQGLMRQNTLLLDTTNMSVSGTAEVDFREQFVEVHLRPEAKQPEFFSVATPVKATGTFAEIQGDPVGAVGVNPGDVVGTFVSFVTSVVHVPLRRIFSSPQTEDDLEECMRALARATPAE